LSNCGAWAFSTLSKFHTTAAASRVEPSWNFTPGRSLNVQFRRSTGSASQLTATPGISLPGRSEMFISQATNGSYRVRPVNWYAPAPRSGWPVVNGTSAIDMP
jgi:hypothetical protein